MPILQQFESFGDSFPPVLARAESLRSPVSVDIDTALYPVQKIFPPAIFAGTTAGSKYRLLPRTRFVSNTGNVMTVSPFTAALFVVGDVINVINLADGTAGAAVGTVTAVNHAANTVTVGTITAPAANTVIGVAASRITMTNGNRIGLVSPNTTIDFGLRANSQFGAFLGATLFRSRMPHIDSQIEAAYPELNFV